MYKIEQYLSEHGFGKLPQEYAQSIVYSNRDETEVILLPKRKVWEIMTSGGPYLITVGMTEPKSDLADIHAKLLKDFINDYMLPLRKALLNINNPWEEID